MIKEFKPPDPHKVKTNKQAMWLGLWVQSERRADRYVGRGDAIHYAMWHFHLTDAAAKARLRIVNGWFVKKGIPKVS